MGKPGAGRRLVWLLAVASLAAAAGAVSHTVGALDWLERGAVDVRFSLRGEQRPPASVAVVGIDNASVASLPRYPFSRTLHARVIEHLHAAGARLIVYDISFDRPTTPRADDALFGAAANAAPVVFVTSLISPSGDTEVLGGNAQLAGIGDRAAAADLVPDGDGVIRHLLDQVDGLPSVAGAVAQVLGRRSATSSRLRGGWIDFPGPPGTVRNIAFSNVLRGRFDRAAVRGKVVIVGATASVLQDLHSTAVGSPMSGPEVQADAIATALAGFPLRGPAPVVTVLLIVLLASIAPLIAVRAGTFAVAIGGVLVFALWSLAVQLAFDAGTVLDYCDPLLGLVLGSGGTLIGSIWGDRRERTRLRELFAADVGSVVEQVLRPSGVQQLAPTAIIAGYRIEEVVGRGGMGVVYRASQVALGRQVAVKLIAPEHYRDRALRERFKSESRMAASIDHVNVIPVYEAGEDDGLLFIAMRLVRGIDLAQLLVRQRPLDPRRALTLLAQLAGALDAAHALGLVHRDVKPANALVTFDAPEHLYLTDFGVATRVGVDGGTDGSAQWVGTLDYLAPEQIQGEAVDARADVYALACVLHQCLIGETPFPRERKSAKLWAHVNAPPPSLSQLSPHLPRALDGVIARGMAKDPADRFASAGALAHALAAALGVSIVLGSNANGPASGSVRTEPTPPVDRTVISE